MNPYYLMTLLYLSITVLAALDMSLVSVQVLPPFPALRWLLVHTVALGALVELIFGLAPDLAATHKGRPRPPFHWNTWLLLNGGLIVLYVGIPLVDPTLIIAGGALIFLAAVLLMKSLAGLAGAQPEAGPSRSEPGRPAALAQGAWYYLAGLFYLLVGVVAGTGLWLGWAPALGIVIPKEVHVHSNLWGFAAIGLAGLLTDLYPGFAGREPAKPRLVGVVLPLMAVGALGMVIGPWLDLDAPTVAGLVLHTAGTVMMLANMAIPLRRNRQAWTAGVGHLLAAYIWFMVAVVVAPLVVAGGGVGAEVAGSGGPILIFGWILQAGYALIPFMFARALLPAEPPRLGGSWLTLATANGGSLVYWASMLLAAGRGPLRAVAYALWIVSLVPIVLHLAAMVSHKLEQVRQQEWRASEEAR